MNLKLFRQAFALLAIVGTLDLVGSFLYLHWYIWWFDVILHFLAGVCVSMGGISVWFYFFKKSKISQHKVLFLGLFFALTIGIIWEIFELHFGLTSLSDGIIYWRDTLSDIGMDFSGGIIGIIHANKVLSKK